MQSTILEQKIPLERNARLAMLRRQTPELPYFGRYVAGDCEAVWADLQKLGSRAREDPFAADVLAVAFETMARARANVETIARRLGEIGYRFFSGTQSVDAPVLKPPSDSTLSQVQRMEQEVGPLPVAMRAWWETSGQVELTGVHPRLSFIRDQSAEPSELEWDMVFTDPLVIYGVEYAAKCVEHMDTVCFSDCASVKADADTGGDPYSLLVETAGADCLVHGFLNVSQKITFVQYLRHVFAWGGFPGFAKKKWERYRPPELDALREGLLPV